MLQSRGLEEAESELEEDARIVLLATAAAGGDDDAFADLYTLLSQRVFNLVLRSVHDRPTAEDICQEVWLKAHSEIRNLKAPEALRSWLYRIASRACIDFARSSRGKHRNDESDIDDFIMAYGPEPEDRAILGSEVRMVWETLGSMVPRQSMAFYLRQVDGFSYDEIAAILECNRPTVEALLFRARQSFARAYQRVESSPAERCQMFSQVMASIIDHEPTALQRSALESHAAECSHCRLLLADTRKANRAYLALPLVPIGKGLALEVIMAGGTTSAGAGIVSTLAGLLGAGAFQAKVVFVGALLVAGGAVATSQVDVPVGSQTVTYGDAPGHTAGVEAGETPADLASASEASKTMLIVARDPAVAITPEQVAPEPVASQATAFSSTESGAIETPETAGPAASSASSAASTGTESTATQPPSGTAPEQPSSQGGGGSMAGPLLTLPEAGNPEASSVPEPGTEAGSQATPGPLQQTVSNLTATTADLLDGVGDLTGETLNEAGALAGDTLNAVAQPVATVIQPVDDVVEDLTGVSANETVDDVLNALPSSSATPVPLDETVEDVLQPVGNLLKDPLQPVTEVLEDPLRPVQDQTDPILGPVLQPSKTPASPPAADPQTGSPSTSAPDAPPEEAPCLLGLLLC